MFAKVVSCVVIASLLLVGSVPGLNAQPVAEAIAQAERDAKADVNEYLWFGAGFFLGVIGVLLAYLAPPSPPAVRLIGKSPEYVAAYTDAYKSAATREKGTAAIIGCGTCAVLYIILYVLYIAFIVAAIGAGAGATYFPLGP